MGVFNDIELSGLTLQSERLTLRPWTLGDVPTLVQIMADARMREYLPLPDPYPASAAEQFITGIATSPAVAGTGLGLAVIETGTGRLVGACTLRLPVARGETGADIGYWIASSDWGRGCATEATRRLAEFGFELGVPRVQIRTAVGNAASAAVALKAGFGFEAILRKATSATDGVTDCAIFARLATDSGGAVPPSWPRVGMLTDGEIALRPTTVEDWPVLLAEHNNPESRRWSLTTDALTEQQARNRMNRSALDWLTGRVAQLVILQATSAPVTSTALGTLQLRHDGPPGVVALGYGVLPEHRGRRVTAKALRLIIDWARTQPSIRRLELGCAAENQASARSAELAGFDREGIQAGLLVAGEHTSGDEIGFGLRV